MRFAADDLNRCWFLAGPTAAGKTAAALDLARRINAEIVSMDSMAIYRSMDIGTAKPDPRERSLVPHHLVDVVDPHQTYSVAQYFTATADAVRGILARRRIPLFVGGTGLYLRSLLRGVFDGPAASEEFRSILRSRAEQHPPNWLHDQLRRVDPASAERLHVNDRLRIIRALEVHHFTGRPLSEQQTQPARPFAERPAVAVWLDPPRAWLHDRINRRVDRMMKQGLLEETRSLLARIPPPGKTARQALGYRELIDHLENGRPLEECVEQIRRGTRQFAKRQHTWFRNLEECRSLPLTGDESPADIANRMLSLHDRS